MTVRGWVLYEDSRTAAGEFTLHRLVMRRVHDLMAPDVGPHVAAVGNMLPPVLQTRVVLLRQNVETLIETLRAGPVLSEVGEATFQRALAKDRTARDGVFAAASRERCRGAREHLSAEVPDFAYLTERILQVVHETTSDGR